MQLAVAGQPIIHSLSPLIFKDILKEQKITGNYFKISTDNPKELIEFCKLNNIRGINVTSPLKETLLDYVDEKSPRVKTIGALNTIIFENNLIKSFNTDPDGIFKALESKLPNIKSALIIGSGGAAKASLHAITKEIENISITCRNEEKGKELEKAFGVKFISFPDIKKNFLKNDLIISTLPSDVQIVKKSWIKDNHTILDAIYSNSYLKNITPKENFIDGKNWLLHQAHSAAKIFLNVGIFYEPTNLNPPPEQKIELITKNKKLKKLLLNHNTINLVDTFSKANSFKVIAISKSERVASEILNSINMVFIENNNPQNSLYKQILSELKS